jgi:hypothetical protein
MHWRMSLLTGASVGTEKNYLNCACGDVTAAKMQAFSLMYTFLFTASRVAMTLGAEIGSCVGRSAFKAN